MLELLNTWQKESQNHTRHIRRTRKHSTVKGHYRCIRGQDTWIEEHTRCAHVVIKTTLIK